MYDYEAKTICIFAENLKTMAVLAVDFGNSRVKFGFFDQNILKKTWLSTPTEASNQLTNIQESYAIEHLVLCASGNSKDFVTFIEKSGLSYEVVSAVTPVPYKNRYATPETLGVDRKVLMVAAYAQYSGLNTLVIDLGTCITYDFKDASDSYLGGAISPGLRMRFKAMHEFTAQLPDIETAEAFVNLIGTTTFEAMQSGVINGMIAEIDGLINRYSDKYEDLKIILTGGDGQFLSSRLKNGIFADSNFLLKGLNYITEFNRT